MANQNFKLDITGWEQKVKNVIDVQARIVKKVVDAGLIIVQDATIKNLRGQKFTEDERKTPSVRAYLRSMRGKLPVNIMTGFLGRSIKIINISTVLGVVYSDSQKANYNRAVHFGYKRTIKSGNKTKTIVIPPKPFLQAAVDERRPAILNMFRYEIIKEINKAGRA